MHMSEPLNAVVAQRMEVAAGLIVLRVVPEGWTVPDFKPGQYVVLGLPGSTMRCELSLPEETPAAADKLIKRAYSIASSSVAKQYLEFYINLVPSGALTPRLFALRVGDRLWLSSKITGMFTLDQVPAGQHIVMIATGTGLAPYMSMLRTELVGGSTRRTAVIHGARHSWELGYQSELMTMAHLCPNFTYIPCVSRPTDEKIRWAGLAGRVQGVWESPALERVWGFAPSPANAHVFLCGNPAMIDDMIVILKRQGYNEHKPRAPGNIHCEHYW
jgi:ferredoxin--NADP+ reductase